LLQLRCHPRLLTSAELATKSCSLPPQRGKTTLYMPKPLSAIYGSRRAWSFGGGFVM
jgi:hypothetical protein